MGLEFIEAHKFDIEKFVENDYFENNLDTSSEWIEKRTGIFTRQFSDYGVDEMALNLVKKFKNNMENLDLIICASFSSKRRMPSISNLVREELKNNPHCLCLDINLACSGFVAALLMAESYLLEGRRAYIFASEKISDFMDMEDRKTAILFGDGAGGVLVEKNNKLWEADVASFPNENSLNLGENSKITMDGKKVYRFAIEEVLNSIKRLLDKNKFTGKDIDKMILHQANKRIINHVVEKIGMEKSNCLSNLQKYGNTSAASIPLVLAENFASIKEGEKIIFSGFGAGLSVVSVLMEW
ncbi:beta-ketoacyl-ACP synthase 3 [Anaerococcus sp. AGMB00486]|uniref:Beta-ketoacyl-ACP synthase 3 n=2 Tax=Anaerococcus TaxID=165779 RepID=A0ABX2NA46_9FIRM|nr:MULTISPECIES: beta-ketoacyl-ACP synthase 3 [Anaerococcus]MDY3006947.1 beta-ketoacyl-ACP synthase 3 [Anaerococcus porci]MSS78330.1 beta-ketoacyl-ACP synthase 3 [Anaerococcus porci]NVF11444.1 beta-ketoacyl-ACP synthase 3 [Anaerococcus faecalis]